MTKFLLAFTILIYSFAAKAQDTTKVFTRTEGTFTACKIFDDREYKQIPHKILHRVGKKIHYPNRAREQGISGEVIVRFNIDGKRHVLNPELIKEIDGGYGCNIAVLDALTKMPRWKQNLFSDKDIFYKLIVVFRFEDDATAPLDNNAIVITGKHVHKVPKNA